MPQWFCDTHKSSNAKCFKCKAPFAKVGRSHKFCSEACAFPPCAFMGCTTPRPQYSGNEFDNMPQWFCDDHKPADALCMNCDAPFVKLGRSQKFCSEACTFPPCAFVGCSVPRPQRSGNELDNMPQWFCEDHKPAVARCMNCKATFAKHKGNQTIALPNANSHHVHSLIVMLQDFNAVDMSSTICLNGSAMIINFQMHVA